MLSAYDNTKLIKLENPGRHGHITKVMSVSDMLRSAHIDVCEDGLISLYFKVLTLKNNKYE